MSRIAKRPRPHVVGRKSTSGSSPKKSAAARRNLSKAHTLRKGTRSPRRVR